MYRERIASHIQGHNWAKLQEPCPEKMISKAEKYVGFRFPDALKELLWETNGDHWFLLSAEDIMEHVKTNRKIFPQYLEPDEFEEKVNRFVPFATNGCGDYYGYRILSNGETDATAIYIWEHELFEYQKVADDIPELINKYYNDEI